MGKAVLLVLSNVSEIATGFQGSSTIRTGFDIKEAALAYHHLHNTQGLEINLASPAGGPCVLDPASLKASEHEEEVQAFLANECAMNWLKCTDRLGAFDVERFQAVLFIGGAGAMMDFAACKEAGKLAKYIANKGGVVAAIGHGAAAFLSTEDWIRHKRVTANTFEEDRDMNLEKTLPFSIEKKLKEAGADFKKADKFSTNVVVDGPLITAQNRNSTREWIYKIEQHLHK